MLTWVADPAGVTREELLAILAASLPALVEVTCRTAGRVTATVGVAGRGWPGRRVPPWAVTIASTSARPRPTPTVGAAGAGGVAAGEPLEGVLDQVRREARARRRARRTRRGARCTVTVVPAGV